MGSCVRRLARFLGVTAVLGMAGHAAVAGPAWPAFVDSFLEQYFAANPDIAASAGRHEFDGRLPDWSERGLQREVRWLEKERREAEAFSARSLDLRQRFEREYLVAQIRRDLFWLTTADSPHHNPFFYADSMDPDLYVSRPYAPLAVRLRAYLRYARSVPAAVRQIRANLRPPLARPLLEIGRVTIGGLADFYAHDVPGVFAEVADPALQAEFRAANAAAIQAVQEFDHWLQEETPRATGDFTLGPERFRAMLRETEGVDLPLAEVEAIGRADLARNTRALAAACHAFAPGRSVAEAVALALAHKPTGSVLDYARNQLEELRQFVVTHELVTVPGSERALVAAAPPYKSWNSAYIMIPGPYEKDLPSVYYVAPPDPSWPRQKQLDYIPAVGPLLFTSAHEVWPGHFLQFLHANRVQSKFGQVFVGYAFSEGWAHYSEEMMWEAGLGDRSPELHIGQLEEALLRDVRFVSAIGLHTHGMTLEASRRMFREEGLQDEADAEQQAQRGTFDPAYLNYTLGKLMIRKLREDWTAPRGGRAAWKAFHDEFLSFGGPPIPLVRRAMLGPSDRGSLFPAP